MLRTLRANQSALS